MSDDKQNEIWLKQYELITDLYKFYWTISLKISGFYLLVVGSVLSFYCNHQAEKMFYEKPLFYFCDVLSLIAAFVFIAIAGNINNLNPKFKALSLTEVLGQHASYDVKNIKVFLFAMFLLAVAIFKGCEDFYYSKYYEYLSFVLLFFALLGLSIYAFKDLWIKKPNEK